MSKCDSALALAAEGFWVFPIVAGKKSPPAVKGWQAWATRDASKIAAHWSKHPDDNIGISTSKFGDASALLVVDVDNKGSKRGDDELVRLEIQGLDLVATRVQDTPSGGRHLVYQTDRPVKQGADVLAPGLDIRSAGGYIVAAGSDVDGGKYTADRGEISLAPLWLVEMCGHPRSRSSENRPERAAAADVDQRRAEQRAIAYLRNEAPLATEGTAGDQTTFRVAARVKDIGLSEAAALDVLSEHWNPRCSPPWSEEDLKTKVRNAYAYGTEPVGAAAPEADFVAIHAPDAIDAGYALDPVDGKHPFDKLNEEFAFCLAGGGSQILWETTDAKDNATLEHLSLSAFHQKFAAHKIQHGKRAEPITEGWMEWKGRRSYDGMVFMPCRQAPSRFYNLWHGFAFTPLPADEQPSPAAQWALDAWLDHLRANVCNGDLKLADWLISYFAHLVQRPWEKPLVALCFKGEKGVGKNAAVERVGALLGQHAMTTADRRYLTGNFNGHLENCLLFVLDEAFWSGDKQAEGIVKNLITGQHHVIEHKGKEQFKVDNLTRIVILGNEDWLVPASHDERRFAVFHCGNGRKQDTEFFEQMRLKMEAGGYRLLLRYLLNPALLTANVNVAPITAALLDQKISSLEPVHQWWLSCLLEGRIVASDFGAEWPEEVACDRVRQAFARYFKDRNIRNRAPTDQMIGRQIKAACPKIVHTKRSAAVGYVYVLPPLAECRAAWDAHLGLGSGWPD